MVSVKKTLATAILSTGVALLAVACSGSTEPDDDSLGGDNLDNTAVHVDTGEAVQPFWNYFWTLDNYSGWSWKISWSRYYNRWMWNYCYGYNTGGAGWRYCYSAAPYGPGEGSTNTTVNGAAACPAGSGPTTPPPGAPTSTPPPGGPSTPPSVAATTCRR